MSINNPIRVAQIMGKLWAGGVEAVVFNYYRKIDRTKVQFDFYYDADSTMEPPRDIIDLGGKFIEIPPYQNLCNYLNTLRGYFRENNYSIVHSHINTLSVFPLYAAWLEHVPVRIAHNHSVPGGNDFRRNIIKISLKSFAKIFSTHYFACSEKTGRWLFGNRAFDEGRVFVVKNAVDFNKYHLSMLEITRLQEKLGLTGKFVVGHVGRFTYAKNHMLLIDIFSEICKLMSDAVLMLVGDGELHEEIVLKIRDKKLQGKVLLMGQVSDPEKYYPLADIMINPSFFEGLSLTTIESQIAGVPVVISEAIPDEAVISNACKYQSISDDAEKWAESAKKMSACQVVLNEKSNDYNIENRADILTDWYVSHSYIRQ